MNKTNRLKGGLYGLIVGDALSVSYEFHPASAIPALELIDMTPPARFRRSHASIKPGGLGRTTERSRSTYSTY